MEFSRVLIDLLCSPAELIAIVEEITVMIEIVKVDLEAAPPDVLHKRRRGAMGDLRNELKGGFDTKRVVEVHQVIGERFAGLPLHVVRHQDATGFSFRPEPDERNV